MILWVSINLEAKFYTPLFLCLNCLLQFCFIIAVIIKTTSIVILNIIIIVITIIITVSVNIIIIIVMMTIVIINIVMITIIIIIIIVIIIFNIIFIISIIIIIVILITILSKFVNRNNNISISLSTSLILCYYWFCSLSFVLDLTTLNRPVNVSQQCETPRSFFYDTVLSVIGTLQESNTSYQRTTMPFVIFTAMLPDSC